MALVSMTGFGRGAAGRGALAVEVELSSVNRRQFELRLSLPRSLSVLEARLTEQVRKRVKRGAVNGSVRLVESGASRASRVCVDEEVVSKILREIRRVGRKLDLADDLTLGALLARPEFVSFQDPADNVESVWVPLKRAFGLALTELDRMRKTEGAELERDLRARMVEMDRVVARIRRLAVGVPARHAALLKTRLAANGIDVAAAGEPLARELAIFADRCDVSEELARLASHRAQFLESMRSGGEAGRTMDFLCQEMFREINTIGSKANDAEITALVVQYKAALEKMREQVQNIE